MLKKVLSTLGVFLVIAIVAFLCLLNWYLLKDDPNRGIFGDMFGGLNTLFSGLAFVGIVVTILLQSKELGLQRKELAQTRKELKGQKEQMQLQNKTLSHQSFENTFFQMVRLHNEIVQSFFWRDPNSGYETRGRECLSEYYSHIKRAYRNAVARAQKISDISSFYLQQNKTFLPKYGHYFRNLYNILKFVHNSNVSDKKFYTNLVRAQLSNPELCLIFYNCLSDLGREKFKPLIEDYSFLKTIIAADLLESEHVENYNKKAFS